MRYLCEAPQRNKSYMGGFITMMEAGEYLFSQEHWQVLTFPRTSSGVSRASRHTGRWRQAAREGFWERIYLACELPTCFLVTMFYYYYETAISVLLRGEHIHLVMFKPLIRSASASVRSSTIHLLTIYRVITTYRVELFLADQLSLLCL